MLVNVFATISAAIKSEYRSFEEIQVWGENFVYLDEQPSAWLVDLITCKTKSEATKIIEDARRDYKQNGNNDWDNDWEYYIGFSYLALIDKKITFEEFVVNLVSELDGTGYLEQTYIPDEGTDFDDLDWIDMKKKAYACWNEFSYLFDESFYLYERKILFSKFSTT